MPRITPSSRRHLTPQPAGRSIRGFTHWLAVISLTLMTLSCGGGDDPQVSYGDPALPDRLQSGLDAWVSDNGLKGAAVKVFSPGGQFEWSSQDGVLRDGEPAPYTTASVTRVGSVTKTMTAVVILQLVREGKLSLDTPLSDFIDYPNGNLITVDMLLRHRSGIYDITLDDYNFIFALLINKTHFYTPQEILENTVAGSGPVNSQPIYSLSARKNIPREPACDPGTCYFYSQPGFVALGLIIETVTGQPLAQVYQERIWGPLGMTHTRLAGRDEPHDPVTYTNLFGLLGTEKRATTAVVGSDVGSLNSNNSVGFSAGGVISSVDDLSIYFEALMNGRLLDDQQFAQLTDWKVTFPDGYGLNTRNEYGLGFQHGIRKGFQIIGHMGSVAGSGAVMQYIPEFDLYVVATRNTDENDNSADRNFPDLIERVKRALKNESQDYTPPAPPTPAT